jgi:hypothetical protein
MTRSIQARLSQSVLLRDATLTGVAVVLAFMALDDITTDNAVRFPLERTMLVACAVWFGFVAWRLLRERHRIAGAVSFCVLALAAIVQPAVGPGISPMRIEYLATFGTLVWFIGLAGMLAIWARREGNRYAA